jgi:hypothetical protein
MVPELPDVDTFVSTFRATPEACASALNPLRAAATLTTGERGRLYTAMRTVLKKSVPTGRVPGYRTWLTGARRLGRRLPAMPTTTSSRQARDQNILLVSPMPVILVGWLHSSTRYGTVPTLE